MQLVKVQPGEFTIRPSSYPRGAKGDRCVEALGTRVRVGGFASVRAATRVKPEQAPKCWMRARSHLSFGERRWDRFEKSKRDRSARRGSGRSTYASSGSQHGRPAVVPLARGNSFEGSWLRQESEEPKVVMKPGNAGGAKGLWFGVRFEKPRGRRSA